MNYEVIFINIDNPPLEIEDLYPVTIYHIHMYVLISTYLL